MTTKGKCVNHKKEKGNSGIMDKKLTEMVKANKTIIIGIAKVSTKELQG